MRRSTRFDRADSVEVNSITAESAVLSCRDTRVAIAQQVVLSYRQSVIRVYEVGSKDVHITRANACVAGTINRLAGPSAPVATFYQAFSAVCRGEGRTVELMRTDAEPPGADRRRSLSLTDCSILSCGAVARAQAITIVDGTEIAYTSIAQV